MDHLKPVQNVTPSMDADFRAVAIAGFNAAVGLFGLRAPFGCCWGKAPFRSRRRGGGPSRRDTGSPADSSR